MEIDKKLSFTKKLFLPFLKVPHNTHYLRKQLSSVGLFVYIPMPVEVEAKHSRTIVPEDYSIYIDHWNYNPVNAGMIYIDQFVSKAFHQPRAHCLSRMLSSKYNYHSSTAL